MNTYWGEMHTHTFCGDGSWRSTEEAAKTAREHLDFWAPGEHHDHDEFDWERICRVTAENNVPGTFVAMPGYEKGGMDGDFNLYYAGEGAPDFIGDDLLDFFQHARSTGGIIIPHHTGYKVGSRGAQWERFFQEDVMPVMEIFSMHGSSERDPGPYPMDLAWMGPRESGGCATAGLKQGLRFGFIASSDGHNGYPGTYGMGLVGLKAQELTREAIFDALKRRHTWAVTGDRIDVRSFQANGQCPGSFVDPGDIEAEFELEGLDTLDSVDVVKNGEIVQRYSTWDRTGTDGPYVLRVCWGWGQEETEWHGRLAVLDGHLQRVAPIFGPPAPDSYDVTDDGVTFSSVTSGYNAQWTTNRYRCGNECGMVLVVDGDASTTLKVVVNGLELDRRIGDMLATSELCSLPIEATGGPWNIPKVKICRSIPACKFRMREGFKETMSSGDFMYLRVRQDNGQMAWVSPVFCLD